MANPNLVDFEGRLKRIQKIRRSGGGFEASGALGRSAFNRAPRRSVPIVGPLLIVLMAVFALKAVIYAKIGERAYESRVAELSAGKGVQPLGAFIMQSDPLTVALAQKVRPYVD
ncbi:hypothetical protein [Acidimangrovimonas sediminis]|uniref:hypothetical protein n=1 Tax=Acidimangrovimonas sediminis TaxID=2056283 RepID=UPI000C8068C9|nr:hypothetical protein [Acidimangrovimonas sediminis]